MTRWNSLTAMFFDQAEKEGDKPFLYQKINGEWTSLSWRETEERVARLSAGLKEIGIEKGDRVALISENRPDWFIADMAIMAAGAISVPTYTTYTARDYVHIFENSGAKAAIVSTKALARNVLTAAHMLDDMQHVLAMEDPQLTQHINCQVHDFSTVVKNAKPDVKTLHDFAKKTKRDDLPASYTPRAQGVLPKG